MFLSLRRATVGAKETQLLALHVGNKFVSSETPDKLNKFYLTKPLKSDIDDSLNYLFKQAKSNAFIT